MFHPNDPKTKNWLSQWFKFCSTSFLSLSPVEVERLLAGEREGRRLYRQARPIFVFTCLHLTSILIFTCLHLPGKPGRRLNRPRRAAGERVWPRVFKWEVEQPAQNMMFLLLRLATSTMSSRRSKPPIKRCQRHNGPRNWLRDLD